MALTGVRNELLWRYNARLQLQPGNEKWLITLSPKVTNKIQELESNGRKITRFSVTGYSLGGLVGRYLIWFVL